MKEVWAIYWSTKCRINYNLICSKEKPLKLSWISTTSSWSKLMEVLLKKFHRNAFTFFTFNSFEWREKEFFKIFSVHLILLSLMLPSKGKLQSLTFIELLIDAGRDEMPQQKEHFFGKISHTWMIFFRGSKI